MPMRQIGRIDGNEQEAAKMGGLPFDLIDPKPSWQWLLETPQTVSGGPSSMAGRVPRCGHESWAVESGTPGNRDPFGWYPSRLSRHWISQRVRALPPLEWIDPSPPRAYPERFRRSPWNWTRPQTRARRVSRAAQPLQYMLVEGWDDCSSPQESVGRGNEETAR